MKNRETFQERLQRIHHTTIDGQTISNADARWLLMQLFHMEMVARQLSKRLEESPKETENAVEQKTCEETLGAGIA